MAKKTWIKRKKLTPKGTLRDLLGSFELKISKFYPDVSDNFERFYITIMKKFVDLLYYRNSNDKL